MSAQHFFMPLVAVGLVVSTLVLSGVARRYQQQQAARRSIVNRMETGIRLIEGLLRDLGALPLTAKLRRTLRPDVLNRYLLIGQVFRGYPRLAEHLKDAQLRLDVESDRILGEVPELADESAVATLIVHLDELSSFIDNSRLLPSPALAERKDFVRQLGEVRAELLSNYHHANFRQKYEAGDANGARNHLRRLMESLRVHGPNTEKVLGLYQAAEEELKFSLRREEHDLSESALKAS